MATTLFTVKNSTYIETQVQYTTSATSTGHKVTVSARIRRTNPGQVATTDSSYTCKVTIDGTTSTIHSGSFTIPANNTSWHDLGSASKTVAHTSAKSITIKYSADGAYTSLMDGSGSGTLSLPAIISAPTGLAVSIVSRTWNSVTEKVSVSSYGTPSSASGRYLEARVLSASGSTATGRYGTTSNTTSANITITNSSRYWTNAFNLVGCAKFYIAAYANNTQANASKNVTIAYYLPPHPLTELSVESMTESETSNEVTVVLTIAGATANDIFNKSGVTVSTQYRYSSDNGTTWSSWLGLGTDAPDTVYHPTIVVPYDSQCKVEARQVYQSQNSEVKSLSFVAAESEKPSGLTLGVGNITNSTVELVGSIQSYGKPDDIEDRRISIGLSDTDYDLSSHKREYIAYRELSFSHVIDNNGSYSGASPLDIIPNGKYYPYIYATNDVSSSTVFGTAVYTNPPDLDTLSIDSVTEVGNTYTVVLRYSYTKAGSALPESIKYTLRGSTYIETISTSGTITLTGLRSGVVYPVSVMVHTDSGDSDNPKTLRIDVAAGIKLYGTVNGKSERINRLYGSVNGRSRRIVKLYGSVNGKSVRVL